MKTTTETCPKCNDRGVIHTEVFPGAWAIGQCDCQPPEYWAAQSERSMAELRMRLEEAKKVFGN